MDEGDQRKQAAARPFELDRAQALDDQLALGVRLFGEPSARGGIRRRRAQRRQQDDDAEYPKWWKH